jgi:prepilin-type N-terminal cleavage/methylation domain-containing protein
MKRSCPSPASRVPGTLGRRGFTMVEMLTVIAIIAILAGILFPVFATVKKNVHKATCTSNLHAIAVALKLYRDDHNTVYPEALLSFIDGATGQEVSFLYPQYVKEQQVFRCPLSPFHLTDNQPVPGRHPTERNGFTKYPNRGYHRFDSYDGQFEPPTDTTNYVVKYVKHWSGQVPGFSDNPRQLLYKNPPEDTVVTWCTYHRDWDRSGATPVPATGSLDLVLYLDGHVRPVPSNQMFPIAPVQGHSYLIGRGD